MDIKKASKDELAAYAQATHQVELDLTQKVDDLRAKVQELDDGVDPVAEEAAAETIKANADFLMHPKNRRVYPATALLRARGDMIPCDKDGKPV